MTQATDKLGLCTCIWVAPVTLRETCRHLLAEPASRGYPTGCSILEKNLPRRSPNESV